MSGRRDFLKALLAAPLAAGMVAAKRGLAPGESELDRLLREEAGELRLMTPRSDPLVSMNVALNENFDQLQRHVDRQARITALLLEERRR